MYNSAWASVNASGRRDEPQVASAGGYGPSACGVARAVGKCVRMRVTATAGASDTRHEHGVLSGVRGAVCRPCGAHARGCRAQIQMRLRRWLRLRCERGARGQLRVWVAPAGCWCVGKCERRWMRMRRAWGERVDEVVVAASTGVL